MKNTKKEDKRINELYKDDNLPEEFWKLLNKAIFPDKSNKNKKKIAISVFLIKIINSWLSFLLFFRAILLTMWVQLPFF